jgi:tetratricopeptide (TPR) repeat protein
LTEQQFAARLGRLGMLQCAMQQWNAAVPLLAEATALFAAAGGALPAQARREQAMTAGALATAHRFAGRPADALAVLRDAVARSGTHANAAPEERIELAHLRSDYAQSLLEAGQPQDALVVLQDGVAALRALGAETGAPPMLRNLMAAMLNRQGHAHAALGRRADAAACLGESVSLMRALVEQEGLAGLADDLRTAEADLARLGG